MNTFSAYRSTLTLIAVMIMVLVAGCNDSPLSSSEYSSDDPASYLGKAGNEAACLNRANSTVNNLTDCVTLDGVRRHQAAFQAVADANGGTRAAGTPGFQASADYVVGALEAAGYNVSLQPFDFVYTPPATLQQIAPIVETYETGRFTGSGTGTVTGQVIPVDLALGTVAWPAEPATSTSGCEASDFSGLDFSGPADIALIQRGVCFFSVKALNAEAAGAEAVIIFNQGTPGRTGLIVGNAANLPDGSPSNLQAPLVGASFNDGISLASAGATAFVDVDPEEIRSNDNILAELPGRNNQNVIVVGSYLDSVLDGPGINDNGSGSAAVLETALKMARVVPQNTVRFAWWGASEVDLTGSRAYVAGLASDELDAIALYLDFSIIGSPNYVNFVLDGDASDSPLAPPAAAGASEIESFFEDFYSDRDQSSETRAIFETHASNFVPFMENGIPIGGVTSGATETKTPDQAALYGGVAGELLDPCFHLACDTFDNVSLQALDVNADAVAASTLSFAMSTYLVNGIRGRGRGNAMSRPNQTLNVIVQ